MHIPDWLQVVLARFESSKEPHSESEIFDAINGVLRAQTELPAEDRVVAIAEVCAFLFHERPDEDSEWHTYFAPMMSGTKTDGTPYYSPDIADFDVATVTHWESRALVVADPVMKARYADLVWDFKKLIAGEPPSPDFARLASDSYLAATQNGLFTMDIEGVHWLRRALALSLKLGDNDRTKRIVDFIIEFCEKNGEPQHAGVWVFPFDELYGKKGLLLPEQEARIIATLE